MLQHVAHVRSGDKGNTSNIAVIAYDAELYPMLKEQLTAERFKRLLPWRDQRGGDALRDRQARRAEFVAHGALGGGVSRSLSLDNYGKALAAAILGFELDIPERLRNALRGMTS